MPNGNLSGLFIVLEGIDGSGKTAQSKMLKEKLDSLGIPCVLTQEPCKTGFEKEIRELLKKYDGALNKMTELFLFEAARREHIEKVIEPALMDGKVVICDRYIDSTVAYQKVEGINESIIETCNKYALPDETLRPDICFWLNASPKQALKRNSKENSRDCKPVEYYKSINKEYEAMVNKKPGYHEIAVFNDETADDVHTMIMNVLKKYSPLFDTSKKRKYTVPTMQVEVYKIMKKKDKNHFFGLSYFECVSKQKNTKIDLSIYSRVFKGTVKYEKSIKELINAFSRGLVSEYAYGPIEASDVIKVSISNNCSEKTGQFSVNLLSKEKPTNVDKYIYLKGSVDSEPQDIWYYCDNAYCRAHNTEVCSHVVGDGTPGKEPITKLCDKCGEKLVWEHPSVKGVILHSSDEVENCSICRSCLVEMREEARQMFDEYLGVDDIFYDNGYLESDFDEEFGVSYYDLLDSESEDFILDKISMSLLRNGYSENDDDEFKKDSWQIAIESQLPTRK